MTGPWTARSALLLALAVVTLAYLALWGRELIAWRSSAADRADPPAERFAPSGWELLVGFVTDFLDTLGIGSYATTTSLYRLRGTVRDELLPGTLGIGHAVPSALQAFLYTTIVDVEPVTLVSMIAASVFGAWLGAGAVSTWSRQAVRAAMGGALLVASLLMLARLADLLPGGGSALGLEGGLLAVGIVANFLLGALMTLGVGLYAPCMILVSLLGMNPVAAFPIMMGSCAFLMPVSNVRFLARRRYSPSAALGLTLAGTPAVLVAAFLVRSLPLDAVRWLVVVVASLTGLGLLRSARAGRGTDAPERADEVPPVSP